MTTRWLNASSFPYGIITPAIVTPDGQPVSFPDGEPLGRGPTLVTLGDSQTARATTATASNLLNNDVGYVSWLQVLSGQRLYWPVGFSDGAQTGNNAGVAGNTIPEMLARVQVDVIEKSPDLCIFWGGTNDVNGITTKAQADQVFAYWVAVVETLTLAGIVPVVLPLLPRTDYDATERALAQYLNRLIAEYCLTTAEVIFANPLPWIVDPTNADGDAEAGMLIDGVHTSPIAAYWIGKVLSDTLSALYTPNVSAYVSLADAYNATLNPLGNLVVNGQLAGTGGTDGAGASGDFADDWTALRTVGSVITVVGAKGTRADGQPGVTQELTIETDGNGAATESIQFRPLATIATGYDPGYQYELECEIAVTTAAANLLGITLSATDGSILVRDMSSGGVPFPDATWSGVMRTQTWTAIGNSVALALVIAMDATEADALVVRVSRFSLRQVSR